MGGTKVLAIPGVVVLVLVVVLVVLHLQWLVLGADGKRSSCQTPSCSRLPYSIDSYFHPLVLVFVSCICETQPPASIG